MEKNHRHRQNHEKPEGDPEQLELYGQILVHDRDFKKAIEVFEDSIAIAPDRVAPYCLLADARLQLNQTTEAKSTMETMLAKNPKSVEAFERYVVYYHRQAGQTSDEEQRKHFLKLALDKAQQALKQSPHNSRCLVLVGSCYLAMLDFDKAEDFILQAIKAAGDSDDVGGYYYQLVQVQKRLNKPVIQTLEEGVKRTRGTPAGLELLSQLAEAQIVAGRFKEAEAIVKDLREENYPRGKTDFLAALAAFQQQNWPVARTLLEESAIPGTREWPPTRARARLLLVQCYRQLGIDVNEQASVCCMRFSKTIPILIRRTPCWRRSTPGSKNRILSSRSLPIQ